MVVQFKSQPLDPLRPPGTRWISIPALELRWGQICFQKGLPIGTRSVKVAIRFRRNRPIFTDFYAMSQHRSLRASTTTGAKRNVLKRFERVALLKGRGQWKEGDRIFGLRKTLPPE